MSLGLFDIVGPIMHGPSSNHTGGANRIGFLAHELMGGTPEKITYGFHPIFLRIFTGHRTHVALTAGCLGIREDDPASTQALETAKRRGITLDYVAVPEKDADRNTMRVMGCFDGTCWEINGISPGGGYVIISRINSLELRYDGGRTLYYRSADRICASEEEVASFFEREGIRPLTLRTGSWNGRDELCVEVPESLSAGQEQAFDAALSAKGELIRRTVRPLHDFAERAGCVPLFDSFASLLEAAKSASLIDLAYQYEENHSGQKKDAVLAQGLRIVSVLRDSIEQGLRGDNPLLCGFCSGSDGRDVLAFGTGGGSLAGPVVNEAMANALALAERSASSGRVVAAPTSGAAGALPGTLYAVARHLQKSDTELAEAFLVSALLGILIGEKGSFAGSVAGCQVEIGIGAAMAAGASVFLAGGSAEQVVDAAMISLSNCFGLTCDQPASPVEVPCIKRNAFGASTAIMGAELALAGVKSAMPADDVIAGFLDIQRRMPEGTHGGCMGGLAVSPYAAKMRRKWDEIRSRKG